MSTGLTPGSQVSFVFPMLEQSPVATVVLDADGTVLYANPAAQSRPNERWWRTLVEDALAGRSPARETDPESTVEWTARLVHEPGRPTPIVVVEGRDVTDIRRADREVRLLMRLALAIGHTDSLELAIAAALQTVCEAVGWVMGEAWLIERATPDVPRLVRAAVWTVRDRRLDAFVAQGVGLTFVRGEGLPGTAWVRAEPVWERQFGHATTAFTRAPSAASAGIRSAVAIPVTAGDEVVAVLSFYSPNATTDPHLDHLVTAVTARLGPLILQKQAEEAHRIAEAKLGGIVSIAVDAIISIDHERRITLFNWGAERVFGYTADEVIGQPLDILLPDALRGRHAAHIAHFAGSAATARRMGERSPIVGMRKNGEIFPAEASISRFRAGGQWTFSVIFRDITDRQRTEEGLRFLAETGALLPDILRDPAVLQHVAERCVPTLGDGCVIELVRDERETTAAAAGEDVAPAADTDGSQLVMPLTSQGGATLGWMRFAMGRSGRHYDASYRALAEELAVRVALAVDGANQYQRTRQAVASRDQVLAVVSHDLRNPLSAIRMCIGALAEQPPPDPAAATELLETVRESTTLMSRIIQDLLDVASIDASRLSIKRRRQPLGPVMAHAAQMFESIAEDGELTVSVGDVTALPDVEIDAERILQVLANLLQNACKFTRPGGTIRIDATALPGALEVHVTDTGAGIAPEDLPRVFDRHWHNQHTTQVRSTGLGLAIARGIIEAHGGRIWVDSTVGKGSTFAFTVPL